MFLIGGLPVILALVDIIEEFDAWQSFIAIEWDVILTAMHLCFPEIQNGIGCLPGTIQVVGFFEAAKRSSLSERDAHGFSWSKLAPIIIRPSDGFRFFMCRIRKTACLFCGKHPNPNTPSVG